MCVYAMCSIILVCIQEDQLRCRNIVDAYITCIIHIPITICVLAYISIFKDIHTFSMSLLVDFHFHKALAD